MKYVISAIEPKNGEYNFYHDEMRGNIADVCSAEAGASAIIRYVPEYDDRHHHVITSKVKAIDKKDNVLTIETNNTVYTFQRVVDAEFTSVWDGGTAVTTNCKVNMATKEVFDIEVATEIAEVVNSLDEEYVTIDGDKYPVVGDDDMENATEEKDGYWYIK